jgi:hypothetical protein
VPAVAIASLTSYAQALPDLPTIVIDFGSKQVTVESCDIAGLTRGLYRVTVHMDLHLHQTRGSKMGGYRDIKATVDGFEAKVLATNLSSTDGVTGTLTLRVSA